MLPCIRQKTQNKENRKRYISLIYLDIFIKKENKLKLHFNSNSNGQLRLSYDDKVGIA
jgi:hypothetical protein